jgi:hypothetical protein
VSAELGTEIIRMCAVNCKKSPWWNIEQCCVCIQGDKGVMQLMLGRHNASALLSSYSSSNVEVKGQSYFFTYTVKALTVTTTARGITSKQLLLGTVTDQVC